jgi:hypothetical protein
MRKFREQNPTSPWSGKPTKEIHHIIPVSVAPDRAADPDNFFPFGSRDEHYIVGHLGISWIVWNQNLNATVDTVRAWRSEPHE